MDYYSTLYREFKNLNEVDDLNLIITKFIKNSALHINRVDGDELRTDKIPAKIRDKVKVRQKLLDLTNTNFPKHKCVFT